VRLALLATCTLALAGCGATSADAHYSPKKAIWGPVEVDGVSQFPIYHKLGVGIYETQLLWANVAPRRPAQPTNPDDPAYVWPTALSQAVADASRYRIRVAVEVETAPPWANGGHRQNWAPTQPADFADFLTAAARRYPQVHLWIIWGEPNRAQNFMPEHHDTPGKPLTAAEAQAPHLYARLLDAAYFALKGASRRNLVIGGDTETVGTISTLNWVRNLQLPDGLPPHMDLYGHDPFSDRRPNLSARPLGNGAVDFSSLPELAGWLDRYLTPARLHRPKLRLFLSEYVLPVHPSDEFNFWVDPGTQASWLAAALKISEDWWRIYALGWLQLYDAAPVRGGLSLDGGLMTLGGRRRPAYYAYESG
jgi:hypothetical protein